MLNVPHVVISAGSQDVSLAQLADCVRGRGAARAAVQRHGPGSHEALQAVQHAYLAATRRRCRGAAGAEGAQGRAPHTALVHLVQVTPEGACAACTTLSVLWFFFTRFDIAIMTT